MSEIRPIKILAFAGRNGVGKDTAAERICMRHRSWFPIAYGDALKRTIHDLFDTPLDILFGSLADKDGTAMSMSRDIWGEWEANIARNEVLIRRLFHHTDTDGYNYRLGTAIDPFEYMLEVFHQLRTLHFSGKPRSVRQLMQAIGTDWGRKVNPDVWTQQLQMSIAGIETGLFSYDRKTGLAYLGERGPMQPPNLIVTDVKYMNESKAVTALGGEVIWIDADKRVPPKKGDHGSQPTLVQLRDTVFKTINNDGTIEEFHQAVDIIAQEISGELVVPPVGSLTETLAAPGSPVVVMDEFLDVVERVVLPADAPPIPAEMFEPGPGVDTFEVSATPPYDVVTDAEVAEPESATDAAGGKKPRKKS
jgi:hypothetical protein